MEALQGMPRVSRGMNEELDAALLADSGPATPATAPWPNFVLSSGCDVPPGVKMENIRAFFRALEDYNQSVK